MRSYRRVRIGGGTYFFTVNLAKRRNNDLLLRRIDVLRIAFLRTKRDHPFIMEAICILPDHLHCVWRLPEGDADFATRWSLIKQRFSRSVPRGEELPASRRRKGERGLWQRRYWEHAIRGDDDYEHHVDYIHYNPVKHGYVTRAADWPYSSLRRMIALGRCPAAWCPGLEVRAAEFE